MVRATTVNVSSCGLYCQTDVQLSRGERFRCLIDMTPDGFRSASGAFFLECYLEVVRIEKQASGFGMGCRIHDYRLLRSRESRLKETDSVERGV
jgi:hypothetical protein